MNRFEFEKLVVEGYKSLPQWVRDKIKNVALLTEDEPSREQRKEQNLSDDETLLGLYVGIPLSERGSEYGVGAVLPDSIFLFKKPIEEAAEDDPEKIRDIVADTIWHEFAHHFGIDEEGVREREEARGIGDYRQWHDHEKEK